MAHKNLLHELLKEDQEPFHLKSYIAERRSQFRKSVSPRTNLQLKKRNPISPETYTKRASLCKHACFLAWQNSPDVTKSPLFGFPSPAKSPCKSPNVAVILRIPDATTALLVEAAVRIQNQSKLKAQIKNVRFGVFESVLKRLKDRSKNKKRAIGSNDIKIPVTADGSIKFEENVGISCSCNNSSSHWSESNEEKSIDLEDSTCSSSRSEELEEIHNSDFASPEMRFCLSPFRFSPCKSPSSSGRNTPEFCSPAASPSRLKQENESCDSKNSEKVRVEEVEEKEQPSPVSVLDPTFEDDEDGHESEGAEEDEYDLECSYANVQRAKEQLLHRLRRFEKLAELDPIELEKKLLEGSDDEYDHQVQMDETFLTEVFNDSTLDPSMKRVVSDIIVGEKSEIISLGRICNKFDFLKEAEFDTIDAIIESDFKRNFDGWKKFTDQVEEIAAEIEFAIFGVLLEQLSDELFDMDGTF